MNIKHAMTASVRNGSSTPVLVDLLANPERALNLAPAEAARLLAQVGALEAVLRARVASPQQNSAQPTTSALWTVDQVAECLVLKSSTVRTYCETGVLPHVSIPAGLRFRPTDIAVWIERRVVRSRPRRAREPQKPLTASSGNDIVACDAT